MALVSLLLFAVTLLCAMTELGSHPKSSTYGALAVTSVKARSAAAHSFLTELS